jgi:hypothetical protein
MELMKRFMVGLDFLYIYAEELMKEYGGNGVPGFLSIYIFFSASSPSVEWGTVGNNYW